MGGTCHRCGLYWSALRTDGLCIKCLADAHYSLAPKPIPAIGESVDTVRLHMSNGVKQGEQRILDKLREACDKECRCGGWTPPANPSEPCVACLIWHRVTGGEG